MTQKKISSKRSAEAEQEIEAAPEQHQNEVAELLDEIDEVLEVNAEAFIEAYVQKGGE